MLDYQLLVDRRITELLARLEMAKQSMESKIEAALEEFIFQEACQACGISTSAYSQSLTAEVEVEAAQYQGLAKDIQRKIVALRAYRARLDDPAISAVLDAELRRFASLTFPKDPPS